MILKQKIVTSVRNFSGIFLTMHHASCYSFKHTLNSCFVLCCKRFLLWRKDAICLYKTRGTWTETVSPFCLLKEIWLTLMYCTLCGHDTKHVYTTNKYWNIFFLYQIFPCYFYPQTQKHKKKNMAHSALNKYLPRLPTRPEFPDTENISSVLVFKCTVTFLRFLTI